MPRRSVAFGERLRFVVGVKLDKLSPDDLQIELLLNTAVSFPVALRISNACRRSVMSRTPASVVSVA